MKVSPFFVYVAVPPVILPTAFSSADPDAHLSGFTLVTVGFAMTVVFLLVLQVIVPPFNSDVDLPPALA